MVGIISELFMHRGNNECAFIIIGCTIHTADEVVTA